MPRLKKHRKSSNFYLTLSVLALKLINNIKFNMMKKILLTLIITVIALQCFNHNLSAAIQEQNKTEVSLNKKESLSGKLEELEAVKTDTTLSLRIGNRNLNVLESLDGPKVTFEKAEAEEEADTREDIDSFSGDDNQSHSHRNRFRGHWTGIEFGFNNYVGSDNSVVLPEEINYMTLHSGKSTNFTINFAQLSLGFSHHTGLVTGLGINWNNYKFDGNNNIVKGPNGVIEELDPEAPLEKSKLATIYMTVPLLFEFQIPVENHSLNMAFGGIGALKLDSHSKMVYQDGNKVKSHGDFSLNIARYGLTARAGYGNFQLYGTYYMKPLFQTGKSPAGYDLYPCELGIAFTFND